MRAPALSPSQPDPALMHRLVLIEFVYLAAVTLIALLVLAGWFIPALGHMAPGHWEPMRPETACAALLSALSLLFTMPQHSRRIVLLGQAFAGLAGLVAGTALLEPLFHISAGIDPFLAAHPGLPHPGRMPAQTAAAFLLLAVVMILIRAAQGIPSLVADVCVSVFCLLVLIIVWGNVYAALHLFGPSSGDPVSPLTLLSLVLLAFVAFARRAEYGLFIMFLGAGAGGRIARVLAPVVLLVPFLPEPVQVQASRAGWMRAEYASALLTSLVAVLGFAVLLTLVWRMSSLERKVRDLSLRDELTGLYNRRGFYLIAWQALRQARRAGLPFSVLFIDLDSLPQINVALGFSAGSEALAEMAELLTSTFRETDVVGRIGSDEFAVAGHFSKKVIGTLAQRLREAANYRNADPGRAFALSFRLGHVTAEDTHHESLEQLLARADKAVYQEIRELKSTRE